MSDRPAESARIFAVVLAAGASHRFGSSKQLALAGGESLVHRAAQLARDSCGQRSVLVAGHDADRVIESSGKACAFLLINEHYKQGIGSSIALAARALRHTADALLLLLADQPLIDVDHLRQLQRRWDRSDNAIVATRFADTLGPPVLLARGAFERLATLRGDRGAKALFADPRFDVSAVSCEMARYDVDTESDLESVRQRLD